MSVPGVDSSRSGRIVTPAFNEDKDPVYEYRGTEVRTIADDKGLFKPDDLRRMGKR